MEAASYQCGDQSGRGHLIFIVHARYRRGICRDTEPAIWESAPGEEKRSALLYYGAQLVVNFFWPLIFFRMDAYVTAFFWLLLFWYLVFVTFQKFYAINPTAGKLLIPYLVWLTFAGYLNLYIAIATL